MADGQALHASIDDFFERSGLTPRDRIDCFEFLEQLYPARHISAAPCQGYCSLTVFVGGDTVVQFRPYRHRLDLRITEAANKLFGALAPETRYHTTLASSGLWVYSMQAIAGIPYRDFRLCAGIHHRARLCKDFARFLSKTWRMAHQSSSIALGRVGKSLVPRLKALATELPVRFQLTARTVLKHIHVIEGLPWVLTHGDLVAANIMVDSSSGSLTGLVDWAEAERLPFGVCLYGLEEILGERRTDGFQYHQNSEELRAMFWEELKTSLPELNEKNVLSKVELARDLGVLLWYGIAFDNGALDRVVQEGRDVEEICRLEAFLNVSLENEQCNSLTSL